MCSAIGIEKFFTATISIVENGESPMPKGLFDLISIGDRIRWLREVRKMTQVELAERVGIKQSSLSNLETTNSRKPAASTLLKLAAILEANTEWIMSGKGDPFNVPEITNADSSDLVRRFERMSPDQKMALMAAAKAFYPDVD